MPYAHPPTSSAVASVTSGADQQRRRFRQRVRLDVYRRYASGMGDHLAFSARPHDYRALRLRNLCPHHVVHSSARPNPYRHVRFLGWVQCGTRKSGPATLSGFPGEKHWHGATATTAITHLGIIDRSTMLDRNGRSITHPSKVKVPRYPRPIHLYAVAAAGTAGALAVTALSIVIWRGRRSMIIRPPVSSLRWITFAPFRGTWLRRAAGASAWQRQHDPGFRIQRSGGAYCQQLSGHRF
jgi:hypothetical protein